jgi:CBS domain-containing protein
MIAENYILPNLEPLVLGKQSNTQPAQVLDFYPVVDPENVFIGFVASENLMLNDTMSVDPGISISSSAHVFQMLQTLPLSSHKALAVLNQEGKYIGIVTLNQIPEILSNFYLQKFNGAILVLEILPKDFSLSEIVRIIESNDIKVLGLEISDNPVNNSMLVHLKLNSHILRNVLATLERFNYDKISYFQRKDEPEDIDIKYKQLLHYLDFD